MSGQSSGVKTFALTLLDQLNIASGHSQAGVVFFNSAGSVIETLSAVRSDIESAINSYGSGQYPTSGGTNINDGLLDGFLLKERTSQPVEDARRSAPAPRCSTTFFSAASTATQRRAPRPARCGINGSGGQVCGRSRCSQCAAVSRQHEWLQQEVSPSHITMPQTLPADSRALSTS